MNGLPRQGDLKQARQSIEEIMQEDTDCPGSWDRDLMPQRVLDLLAAIDKRPSMDLKCLLSEHAT